MINVTQNKRKNLANELAPDLTPLLDVVFMLIVFLILTINSSLYSIDVKLPQDKEDVANQITDDKKIAIHLLPQNDGWKIDKNKFLEEQDFRNKLQELSKKDQNLAIMIISDKNAPISKLINLLTFLEKLNIKNVNIAVERVVE